jgi:hypothetical protein
MAIVICPVCGTMTSATGTGTRADPQVVAPHETRLDGPPCITEPTLARQLLIRAGRPVSSP